MNALVVLTISALVACAVGALVRRVAIARGAVVAPRPDRWHRTATPTFGGIAILAGLIAGLSPEFRDLAPAVPVLAACVALFVVGWYDDVRPLSAAAKMVTSLAVAGFFVFLQSEPVTRLFGVSAWGSLTTGGAVIESLSPVVSLIAIVWFGGLDNAVNLLDNMDGLAAGVTAIAAIGLAAAFGPAIGHALVMVLVALAGGLIGFLFWNRHPARLFMGNCGSLAVGGVLAGISTIAVIRVGTASAIVSVLLILVTPLFDTTFVVLLRRLAGRSTTRGNIDHTSHRLVSARFTDSQATLILCGIGAVGATTAYLIQRQGLEAWSAGAAVGVGVAILALYLARVPAYAGEDFRSLKSAPLAPMLSDLTFRWHAGEVLLDLVLITICYDTAYRLRFAGDVLPAFLSTFAISLPVIVGCKIAALYASGLYSRPWSTFGFHDLTTVLRGVALGSTLSILAATWLSKFQGFSRGVFLIDAVLLTVAIVGTRLSFRMLARIDRSHGARRRALVIGAGPRGQLLVRELRANPEWGLEPVAFLDHQVERRGYRILGIPVRGGLDDLDAVMPAYQIDEVLISSSEIDDALEATIRERCQGRAVVVRRFHLDLR